MQTASFHTASGAVSAKGIGRLDAMAFSSAFWVAGIVESATAYTLGKGTLMKTNINPGGKVYMADGGFIDTTGIVLHLQRRVPRILAFYNNNDDLKTLNSTIAYLFGAVTPTDGMNALPGPKLMQVFPRTLFEGVMANLTDGNVLRARLTGVEVLTNTFLGVESFTLEELIVISNQFSSAFVNAFQDVDIRKHLSSDWPDSFPISMPTLDANMLCMFNEWKTILYRNEIARMFAALL